jgi:predicted anti-sigma-YlaC factor YlaD
MSCLKLSEIYDYLEKQLPEEESQLIEKHLKSCPRCRQVLRERQVLLTEINRLPRLEPPEEFTPQLMARLPELSPKKTWLVFLAGGLYFLFSLLVVFWIMAARINTLAWTSEVFKYIFSLAWQLSRMLILVLRSLQALAKFFSIIGKVIINFLATLFPPIVVLTLSTLGVFISLALVIWLIKNIKISERS